MATIGLDKLFYAPITEDASGEETYGTPVQLAKAMTAELSVELAEATLYADDGDCIRELKKEVSSGSGSVSFQIEGTAGRELESGDYLVCYEIADASGKKAKGSHKVTLSVPTR